MASLLKLPQTTTAACSALFWMYDCHQRDFYYQDIYFSSAYNEIMQTLLALFPHNGISIERRQAVMGSLFHVLDYESEDTIFKVAEKYKALLAMDSNPSFQAALIGVLSRHMGMIKPTGRGVCTLAEFPGLLEDLMALLLFGKDHEVRLSAAKAIRHLSGSRRISLRIAVLPNALQMLFDSFISDDIFASDSGEILSWLSSVPQNRIKFREIQGIWEGLGSILAKLEGAWRELRDEDYRKRRRASIAATIFGYLGLEKDFRDTIASLPGVGEGLMFLQLTEMARAYSGSYGDYLCLSYYCSTHALTTLYSNPAEQRSTSLPPLEDVLEILAAGGSPQSKSIAMASAGPDICSFSIYWTRVLAYIQMGSYQDALSNLNLAHRHLDLIPIIPGHHLLCQITTLGYPATYHEAAWVLRKCRAFLQVMQKDYAVALSGRNLFFSHGERGVLKWLSGDLQGALEDLDAAAVTPFYNSWYDSSLYGKYDIFKHRGYVKYLMGDEIGATEDGERAKNWNAKNTT